MLLKKILSFSIGDWGGIILGILCIPLITRTISPEDFGYFSIFSLCFDLGYLFVAFGMEQAFMRFFFQEKQNLRFNFLLSCLQIPIISTTLLSILIIIFHKKLSDYICESENLKMILALLLLLVGNLLVRFPVLVVRMKQQGIWYSSLQLIQSFCNFSFILLFCFYGKNNFMVLVYARLIAVFIAFSVALIPLRQFFRDAYSREKKSSIPLKQIVIFSFPLMFSFFVNWLFQGTGKIALQNYSTAGELGIYSTSYKLCSVLLILQSSFCAFWTPVAYEKYTSSFEDRKFFSQINYVIAVIMFLLILVGILFRPLCPYVLGMAYHETSFVMPLMLFVPAMYTLSETTVIGINFAKKTYWHFIILSCVCALNIVLCCIFVKLWGAKGAAISFSISYIVFYFLRSFVGLRHFNFNIKVFQTIFIVLILFGYGLWSTFVSWSSWEFLFVGIIASIIIFLYRDILNRCELRALFLRA